MARKDMLAAGARSAKFAGGTGEGDIFRNVSKEPRVDEVIVVEHKAVVPKIFRPLGTALLVRQSGIEAISPLLVGVDAVKQDPPAEGTVIVIGKKVVDVNPGDLVVFGKYAGTEFKLNGETLLIMDETDIKGVIETLLPETVNPTERLRQPRRHQWSKT